MQNPCPSRYTDKLLKSQHFFFLGPVPPPVEVPPVFGIGLTQSSVFLRLILVVCCRSESLGSTLDSGGQHLGRLKFPSLQPKSLSFLGAPGGLIFPKPAEPVPAAARPQKENGLPGLLAHVNPTPLSKNGGVPAWHEASYASELMIKTRPKPAIEEVDFMMI